MRRTALIMCLACLSCSDREASDGVVVADSSGVAVVSNSQVQVSTAQEWRVGAVPSARAPSGPGDLVLYQVHDVTRTGAGGIVVANRGSNQVLLFNAQGGFVGSRGREGDGPGEFRRLSSVLSLGGDSLGVYDSSHKRFSVFGPDGQLVREFTLDTPGDSDYEKLFKLPDGGLAVFGNGGLRGGQAGIFRSMAESFAVDRNGMRVGSFGTFPGAEVFVGRMAGLVLFGANTFGAVVGEHLLVGTGEDPEVRLYGRDGHLKRIVRWPDRERGVTEERVAEYLAAAEATLPEAARSEARAMLAEIPRSDHQPAFEDVLVSPAGEVWVGEYRGPEMALPGARSPSREWLIFDPAGVLKARLRTPVGFQPLRVGTDEVVGVYVDEFGVESVVVYAVLRDGGRGNGS